jgi:hypothetical protein
LLPFQAAPQTFPLPRGRFVTFSMMLQHVLFHLGDAIVGRYQSPASRWALINQDVRQALADQQAAKIVDVSRKTITS